MEPQGVEPQPQDFQSCAPTAYAKVPYLILEGYTGFEPVLKILQTFALPTWLISHIGVGKEN